MQLSRSLDSRSNRPRCILTYYRLRKKEPLIALGRVVRQRLSRCTAKVAESPPASCGNSAQMRRRSRLGDNFYRAARLLGLASTLIKCQGRQLAPNLCKLGGGSVWDVVMQPSPWAPTRGIINFCPQGNPSCRDQRDKGVCCSPVR